MAHFFKKSVYVRTCGPFQYLDVLKKFVKSGVKTVKKFVKMS